MLNFQTRITTLLELAVETYEEMAINGKLSVSNQFAPSDCETALETSKIMSEKAWQDLKTRIGDSKVEGWNLALYVNRYSQKDTDHEDFENYLASQY